MLWTSREGILLLAALAMLLLGVGACLAVLFPTRTRKRDSTQRRRWVKRKPRHPENVVALAFALNVEVMIDHAEERGVEFPDTARMAAARTLQLAWDENTPTIVAKQRAFMCACVALLAQATSWIIFIALGRGVI